MTTDEVLATAAARQVGLLRSDRWPLVAAHLIALGYDGPDLLAMACLTDPVSGWQVGQLIPGALQDINAPHLTLTDVAEVVARLIAQWAPPGGDFPILRTLARLAPELNYPTGLIGQAYNLDEWLDCDCHTNAAERVEAHAFEEQQRRLPPLNVTKALTAALLR